MVNEWTVYSVDKFAEVIGGGTPSTSDEKNFGGNIPWITPKDLSNHGFRYIARGERNITEKGLNASNVTLLPTGTVLLSSRAPVGYLAIASNPVTTNQGFKSLVIRDGFDNEFVYYLLKTNVEYLKSHASGTTFGELSGGTLKRLKFNFPPIPEQHAIAGMLGALDDKIEVNRRMNVTLESMARAVFREMTKNENGKWKTGSILEFANLLSGGTPSTSEESYWNGSIEWASAKDVGNVGSIFLLDTEKKITQIGVDNSSTKLLPKKTTIVTARGTVGAHCMLGKAMTMNQTNYGLKAKEGIGDYFVYFTLSEMVEQLKQQSYGTIFDTITTKTFQSAQCAQPPHKVIQKFESQVAPLMAAILNNQKESRTLANLRDSLLPKLMRGEVRVMEE